MPQSQRDFLGCHRRTRRADVPLEWLPKTSRIRLYFPGIACEQIVNLQHAPGNVQTVDSHTLELVPDGVAYVPLPPVTGGHPPAPVGSVQVVGSFRGSPAESASPLARSRSISTLRSSTGQHSFSLGPARHGWGIPARRAELD